MPVLQVRLDDADHNRMREIAEAAGISVSEQVRVWINNKATPALDAQKEVVALREEVKALKIKLAERPTATVKGNFPIPKAATVPIRQPMLMDDPNSPFARFGQSRPAPKPSQKKR